MVKYNYPSLLQVRKLKLRKVKQLANKGDLTAKRSVCLPPCLLWQHQKMAASQVTLGSVRHTQGHTWSWQRGGCSCLPSVLSPAAPGVLSGWAKSYFLGCQGILTSKGWKQRVGTSSGESYFSLWVSSCLISGMVQLTVQNWCILGLLI